MVHSIFRRFSAILLVLFAAAAQAQAICDEERAAFLAADLNVIANERERTKLCGDQRLCKKDARVLKRDCKQTVAEEKFACRQACKRRRGAARRQCKKACRQSARLGRLSCRNLKRQAVADCRAENAECVDARARGVELGLTGTWAVAAFYQCLRRNAGAAETEQDREDVEDARAAGE